MKTLAAYIDDSGKEMDSPSMVLAGYLGDENQWNHMAIEWNGILKAYRLKTFHMVAAWNMRSEYSQISMVKRNQLIMDLVKCTKACAEHAFVVSIDTEAYRHWFARGEFPEIRLTRPYFVAYHLMLSLICNHVYNFRDDHDLEITFDEQGGESASYILESVEHLREAARLQGYPRLRIPTPCFKPDDDIPPLQAADILAWLCRRENSNYRAGKSWRDTAESKILDFALDMPSTIKLFGDRELKAMAEDAAQRFESALSTSEQSAADQK